MASVILFIIIAYLFKRGLVDGRGFSDIAKIFGVIIGIFFIVSIITTPAFWIILGLILLALIVGGILLAHSLSAKSRAEKYGWDTEEYQQKYSAAVEKFKNMYRQQRELSPKKNMTATEKRMQDLEDEKKAREAAAEEVDAEFRAREAAESAKAPAGGTKGAAHEKKSSGSDHAAKEKGSKAENKKTKSEPVSAQSAGKVKSRILPKASGKRTKIVSRFNDQYDLYLTEDQIKRIVDSSYMSNAWKREVEAMADKYDSVNQWLYGDTAYLRAYLRAFTVQDVTSDFQNQMQIVMDSFEEVFKYSDELTALSVDQRIEKINSKFMTNFDEITYMIAYRFLEQLGLKHDLDKKTLNRIDGTFDDLVHKYDKMSDAAVDSELKEAKPAASTKAD